MPMMYCMQSPKVRKSESPEEAQENGSGNGVIKNKAKDKSVRPKVRKSERKDRGQKIEGRRQRGNVSFLSFVLSPLSFLPDFRTFGLTVSGLEE